MTKVKEPDRIHLRSSFKVSKNEVFVVLLKSFSLVSNISCLLCMAIQDVSNTFYFQVNFKVNLEAYSEPSKKAKLEVFCENNKQLSVVN